MSADRHRQPAFVVRLSEDLKDALRERARREERTQAKIVERALRAYLATDPDR